jgi:hypothetical protein
MSVSLLEVIESAGYDLTLNEDCIWLLSKQSEFEELLEIATERVEGEREAMQALEDRMLETAEEVRGEIGSDYERGE